MRKITELFREYRSILLIIVVMVFFRTALADWSPVPSSSMEPTIFPGDVLWVNKTSYGPSLPFLNKRVLTWGHPERGDIITFIPPHEETLFVKRVMAIPGDVIRIEGNHIQINGTFLEQSLTDSTQNRIIGIENLDGHNHAFTISADREVHYFGETIVVPDKKYFVMGDFRNNSADSRYWGLVDEHNIMGKVSTVAVSFASERTGMERLAIAIQ